MKRYNQLLKYISRNYSDYIFISLFYSLWLVYKYAYTFNPELQSFSGRMISEATLQGYDIGKRIKTFYLAGALFLLSTLFFSILAWRISSFVKDIFKSSELKIINYTSLAGVILYLFTLWGFSISSTLELIYCIHKAMLLIFIIKRAGLKNIANTQHLTTSFYSIAFVIGVSVFFIWNETAVLSLLFPKTNFLIILFAFVVLISIATLVYIKRKTFLEAKSYINRIAFLLVPLAFIPLLSFLKDEIYLILNRQQIHFLSPGIIYIIGLLLIISCILWRYFQIKKQPTLAFDKNTYQLMATRYFPLLVLGIVAYTFYNPVIQASTEMFEAGNRFLPLMEYQKFGVIPILEKFNAHQLFEIFWGGIYTFFNGLHGREMLIYDFMDMVIWSLLVYWFIYKLSHNPYVAIFITLIFPLTAELIHLRHSIAFLAIFLLHAIIHRKASLRSYLLLFICIAFLIFWRMDIGYPSVVAITGTLFIYWINEKKFSIDLKLFLKSLSIFSLSCLLLLSLVALYRHINIFDKLLNGFHYLTSAQSYGYVSMGDPFTSVFKMQHFIFPLVMILGVCVLLAFFKRYTISRSQRFVYTSFIFLTIYYFVNFQRGIVAHTFAAGSDGWLSPFLFLILGGSIYLFMYKRSQLSKFVIFVSMVAFLIINYKYPALANPQNIYSQTALKINAFQVISPAKSITRCIDDMKYEREHFSNFKNFIDEHLSHKQTFIDFSNAPMLYYYTGKLSPSYFYQNPLTNHNDELQNNFISELNNYDAPFIVFSNLPETYWDNVNGVPNALRHYRMAEYFYQNYKPFTLIDNLCIWKRNNFKLQNDERLVYQYTHSNDSIENNSIAPIELYGKIYSHSNKKFLFKVHVYSQSVDITVCSENKTKNLKPIYFDYRSYTGYYILDSIKDGFSFQLKNINKNIGFVNVYECDYIPDFYSTLPKNYNINQLPYIWGKYDDSLNTENVIVNLLPKSQILKNNKRSSYYLPSKVDKSSGNTLLISLQCNNDIPAIMELIYAGKKEGYKGTFSFSIPPGKGTRKFAIRISSQYNWYSNIDFLGLSCNNIESVTLHNIKLLKGK